MARKVKRDGYCIFIQTDRKYEGRTISKSVLVTEEMERSGSRLLWHKIALHREVGKCDLFRPTYAHMLCFSKEGRPGKATPDVLGVSERLYRNATPLRSAYEAVRFIATMTRQGQKVCVVDPFVGRGTVTALASLMGMDSIGIDLDGDQIRRSKRLDLEKLKMKLKSGGLL